MAARISGDGEGEDRGARPNQRGGRRGWMEGPRGRQNRPAGRGRTTNATRADASWESLPARNSDGLPWQPSPETCPFLRSTAHAPMAVCRTGMSGERVRGTNVRTCWKTSAETTTPKQNIVSTHILQQQHTPKSQGKTVHLHAISPKNEGRREEAASLEKREWRYGEGEGESRECRSERQPANDSSGLG